MGGVCMSTLIERTVDIPNLPIGAGSALGAFIRALYLTATRKICIVGLSVNLQENPARNYTIFDPLDDASTALVSDLVLHLTTEPYYIGDFRLSGFKNIGAQSLVGAQQDDTEPMIGLYTSTINWRPDLAANANKVVISKTHFSSVLADVCDYSGYKFPDSMVTLSPSAKPLNFTLYLSQCRGNFTQADSSAFLDSCGITKNIIPVAGCGQRTSKCWFTISNTDNAGLEKLTLHLAGDAICIEDDMKQLQQICSTYSQICNTALGNMR